WAAQTFIPCRDKTKSRDVALGRQMRRGRVVRLRKFISSSPIGFLPRESRPAVEHRAAIHLVFDDSLADPAHATRRKDPRKEKPKGMAYTRRLRSRQANRKRM